MSCQLPPLDWLRAFEVTARHSSFTEAADELNVSRTAVSRQVTLLEERLGEPLFVRLAERVSLTPVGARYLAPVQDALGMIVRTTADNFCTGVAGRVVLRAEAGFLGRWLAPRLPDLRAALPDLELHVGALSRGEHEPAADLEIRFGSGGWLGAREERLTHEHVVPVTHGDCGLACHRELHERLASATLVSIAGDAGHWQRWLVQQSAECREAIWAARRATVEDATIAYALVRSGDAVTALGYHTLVVDDLASGVLAATIGAPVPIEPGYFAVAAGSGVKRASIERLIEWLRQALDGPAVPDLPQHDSGGRAGVPRSA